MSVFLKLQEDVKEAMKARDQEKLLALRTLTSDIKKITIDAGRREPTDDDCVAAVTKAIKQREDAASQMDAGGRPELAERERTQADLFRNYQPAQLTPEELEVLVREAIATVGATSRKEMGKVMGVVSPKTKGRADGKSVQALVQALLPA
ncbi:MAG: GatB/YqeY domain-containing protein [Fibrobacterota bacterium]|nr:GatB/YqeY domain-containing protein [Fibrobacterota bacterium]QQS05045.1 MAG: GatB/YqeY domain-containing protein [Fibrobacterota bacterium]